MTTTMLPDASALITPAPGGPILPNGRAEPALREDLRRIPTARNLLSVASWYAQTLGLMALAVWLDHPAVWVVVFLLMGRAHAQVAALMHEAAHRLLVRNKALNDWIGRWLLAYPSFTPIDSYRRGHMAHHREEFGPNEPDIPLYRGYPITTASFRRKLWRDATGQTGLKLLRGLFRAVVSADASTRRQARSIIAVQLALIAAGVAVGHPWLWLLLWFLPYLTVWRVINRLRSIAEHGGMQASPDRRATTHSVHQHALARFALVPYCIGWHLAHHLDSGIPFRNLPRYHRALVESGYVDEGLEYPTYRAIWRALRTPT